MHHLSQLPGGLELKVELADIGTRGPYHQATYSHFSVGDKSSNYALSVSGYNKSSSLFDYFGYLNGFPFSTVDRDNDGIDTDNSGLPPELIELLGGINCAMEYGGGGWWYGKTSLPALNGVCVPGTSLTAPFLTTPFFEKFLEFRGPDSPKIFRITEIVMKARHKNFLCRNVQSIAEEKDLSVIRRLYPQLFAHSGEGSGDTVK